MKYLVLILILLPGTLLAQAINQTDHIDYPLSGVLESPCGGEPVAISGMMHGVVHVTISANHNSASTDMNFGPRGDMKAVGLDTGTQYNLNGNDSEHLSWSKTLLEGVSGRGSFNVVGLFKVHYTYHFMLMVDNWETPKLSFDHLVVECPGDN
jgi:hypothetical protein